MQNSRFVIGVLWGTLLSLPIWAVIVSITYWIWF
ncbi:hypothetical protein JOC54_004461 [Alkalihalobacillus xiaoxiensis]|uniref:Uncharacterized protein n=1 Tax=Shouchella xiaoxiensis TaxID=766895 RepID=A0ABS2T0Y2_9BACI|nr:hypothetical protein [Shouchella xiaoxiensis]